MPRDLRHQRLASLAHPPLRLALPALALAALALAGCTPSGPPAGGGAKAEGEAKAAAKAEVEAKVEAAPEPVSTAVGAVELAVIPGYGVVDAARLPGELDLLIRLRGDETAAKGERPALDLAVVLDRSGSMVGDKILAVKQASLDLLKDLQPRDRITLLSYSDDVIVHAERITADAQGVDVVRGHLLPINADGGTALGPGMVRGLEILEAAKRPEQDLAHVLLLSDGQANVGESRPDVLGARAAEAFKKGVSVSTLGVGLDYNEDLMTKLADQGGGRYHFIQDNQAIPRVLADEFAGLVATVASGMSLELRLGPGVEVVKVFGYPSAQEGGSTRVRVGSLAAAQDREIVVRVRLPAASGEQIAVGVVAVDFTDLTRAGEGGHAEVALSIPVSKDPEAVRRAENTEVTVRVAEVESAAQLEAATRAMAEGNYDQAKQMIQSNIDGLQVLQKKAPSAKLAEQIADLEEAAQGVESARESGEEMKKFQKLYKSKAYSKGKGAAPSSKKSKPLPAPLP